MNTTSSYPRTFPTSGPVSLSVRSRAGRIHVEAAEVSETVVDMKPTKPGDESALEVIERARVEQQGDTVYVYASRRSTGVSLVRDPAIDIRVTVPADSAVEARSGSATMNFIGKLGQVSAKTGSGDVNIEQCADASVKTGSGDIRVDGATGVGAKSGSGDILVHRCSGGLDADTASGKIQVDHVRDKGDARTASGNIEIDVIEAPVNVKTASGDIRIRQALEGDLAARTASGNLTIGVVHGTAARLDCTSGSGRVRSELDPADAPAQTDRTVIITARSASGSIAITRAS